MPVQSWGVIVCKIEPLPYKRSAFSADVCEKRGGAVIYVSACIVISMRSVAKRWYVIAALYFFLLQAAYVFTTTLTTPPDLPSLFSYCNHAALLLALAFLFGRTQIVKAVVNIGLLIQGVWLIDFLGHLVFGLYIFGVTKYIFAVPLSPASIISIVEHSLTMLIAIAVTYKIRPRAISLIYSFLYILLLYIITLLFTPPVANVNCVFQACVFKTALALPQFTALWPVFVMILAIVGYLIQMWLYRCFFARSDSNTELHTSS
jgi:hypothetical protein